MNRFKAWHKLKTQQVAECKNHSLIIGIYQKKIVNFIRTTEKVDPDKLISSKEILTDSTALVQRAKNQHKLKPGINWAKGYHFSLMKNENILFLGVVGLDQNNQFSKIYFNPITGDFLGSSIKNN